MMFWGASPRYKDKEQSWSEPDSEPAALSNLPKWSLFQGWGGLEVYGFSLYSFSDCSLEVFISSSHGAGWLLISPAEPFLWSCHYLHSLSCLCMLTALLSPLRKVQITVAVAPLISCCVLCFPADQKVECCRGNCFSISSKLQAPWERRLPGVDTPAPITELSSFGMNTFSYSGGVSGYLGPSLK